MQRRAPRGFTLVQLLVVLGLLAILLSLLLPVIANQRSASRTLKCIHHLRVIGAALSAYAADRGGWIPPRNLGNFRPNEVAKAKEPAELRPWGSRLVNLGYIENDDVLYCPSFAPRNQKESAKDFKTGNNRGYGIRTWGPPGRYGLYREEEKRLAWIEKPSEFFIVGDSYWSAWKEQGYGITPGADSQAVHLRHEKKANLLFADGHVEAKDAAYFETLHHREVQGIYSNGTETKDGAIIYTTFEGVE